MFITVNHEDAIFAELWELALPRKKRDTNG